ncbi:CAAX prenyl protease-related protein [uncultured Desulfuromonas sp.]|uniref:CAAX prenyl protease-related protein n=1 Tax=uncultured Desulfuromonas sp. TaxID=181013 RepID=UPI002AAAE5B7|nr:CAAX prenyl protease-related protein [uncultured Desulfuromonas sp.]
MPAFYRSTWFPYVLPFLLYLILVQAEEFLPQWHHHLYGARVLLCAGFLWMWRKQYGRDVSESPTARQYLYALLAGALAFSLWPLSLHVGWITLTPVQSTSYSVAVSALLLVIKLIGFIAVFPIMNELFWRSFMLRYFISADFRSVDLGQFQLFSLIGVTVLSGLAFHYGIVLGGVSLIMCLLLIWQKNLVCCIVAHGFSQILVAAYMMMNHAALF